MSAIFGIIDFEGRPIDPEWIKSMQRDLAHRGPDGQGLYQEESMFMGHMLLQVTPESIYDKSPYEEDGLVITAHARLDEREAIMDRLGIPDTERETIVDALLLLRSFKKYGKDFVKDIYGDFAFAIWDKENKELFCARDQIGVKPFLYYFEDNRFVFSTEIKAIVKIPFLNLSINESFFKERAIGLTDNATITSWQKIRRLKPAFFLICKKDKIYSKNYWSPTYKPHKKYKKQDNATNELLLLLEKVIIEHARSIQKVGVPLSGGLDSSTITCLLAKRQKKEDISIITASSVLNPKNEKSGVEDEIHYINSVLQKYKNIIPEFIFSDDLSFNKNLHQNFEKHYSSPGHWHYIDNALNQKFKNHNVRRVLSGYLGDSTISNSSINPFPYLLLKGKFLLFFKFFTKFKNENNLKINEIWKSKILFPLLPLFLKNIWYSWKKENKPWKLNNLPFTLSKKEKHDFEKRLKNDFEIYECKPLELSNKIWGNWEAFDELIDCGSSHYNLEYSFPLLDRRIIEFLMQIPVEHFQMNGIKRGLIREAMKGILPEKVRLRTTKLPYSPGFRNIHKRDIFENKKFLDSEEILQNSIFRHEIKEKINKFASDDSLDKDYWAFIISLIWINFNHFLKISKHEKE